MNQKLGARKRRLLAGEQPDTRRFFHGGSSGLLKNQFILPPSVTKRPQNGIVRGNVRRNDRAYITTDVATAILWAAQHPSPALYEVKPVGDIDDDPDRKTKGVSFECEKAKIVRVHRIPDEQIQAARKVLLQ